MVGSELGLTHAYGCGSVGVVVVTPWDIHIWEGPVVGSGLGLTNAYGCGVMVVAPWDIHLCAKPTCDL